jgi:hypothetical protein
VIEAPTVKPFAGLVKDVLAVIWSVLMKKDPRIELRKRIGLERPFRTQREMAKYFDVHESYMSLVLNGLRPIPDDMLAFLREPPKPQVNGK